MNHNTTDLKPMRIGDVIDYSIEIFKTNFKTLALLSLILYVPWIFISSLISSQLLENQLAPFLNLISDFDAFNFEETYDYQPNFNYLILNYLLMFLDYAYKLSIKVVFHAAIILVVYDYVVKGTIMPFSFQNTLNIIKQSFSYILKLAGYTFLFGLIMFGVMSTLGTVLVFLIGFLSVFIISMTIALPFGLNFIASLVAIILGVLLLLAGFILLGFFWVKFIFGFNLIVVEKRSVGDSLKRSFDLSKGYFWHIGLSSLLSYFLFSLIGGMFVLASLSTMFINNILYSLLFSFAQVFNAILYPFIYVFITVLFIDMKVRKEGLDLDVKFNKLISRDS
ncbi:UNVERIFIED_CONTAM: hypothetical protein Cloal_0737 [Acetivibrio alkalicellulosi]